MKKLIVSAFCLGLTLTAASVMTASNQSQTIGVVTNTNDDRQPVKAEELPEPIKKVLAGDAYKGWTVKEATMVSNPAATTENAAAAKDVATHYEVVLTKDKESKTFRFQKDGTLLN